MFFPSLKRSFLYASAITLALHTSPAFTMEEEPETRTCPVIRGTFEIDQANTAFMGSFPCFPSELLQFMDLDMVTIDGVCKTFYNNNSVIINSIYKEAYKSLHNKGENLENIQVYLHPHLFRNVYQTLFSLYSSQGLEPTLSAITHFKASIKDKPNCLLALHHTLLDLDPADLHQLKFVVPLIKDFPDLQVLLVKTREETMFESKNFLEEVKNVKNHKGLHKHLISLKLLALSDYMEGVIVHRSYSFIQQQNTSADRLDTIGNILYGHFLSAFKSATLVTPLWSLYTEYKLKMDKDEVGIEAFNRNFLFAFLCADSPHRRVAIDNITKLFKHEMNLKAEALGGREGIILFRDGILVRSQCSELFSLLDFVYDSLDKSNFYHILEIYPLYAKNNHHEKAVKILEEAYQTAGESPWGAQLLFNLATLIVEADDSTRYKEAEDHIKKLRSIMAKDRNVQINQSLIIDTRYDVKGRITSCLELPMYSVRNLEAVLEKKKKAVQ